MLGVFARVSDTRCESEYSTASYLCVVDAMASSGVDTIPAGLLCWYERSPAGGSLMGLPVLTPSPYTEHPLRRHKPWLILIFIMRYVSTLGGRRIGGSNGGIVRFDDPDMVAGQC
jgi:hypothetical protein